MDVRQPLLWASLLWAASLSAHDWPQYRGPNADAVVAEPGLNVAWPAEGLPKLWSAPLGDGGGGVHGGAAVASGKVYVFGKNGKQDVVFCFDAAGGKELWKHEQDAAGNSNWGSGARCTPTVAGGRVFALNRYGLLTCLDAEKGGKLWSRDIVADFKGRAPSFGIAASPVVSGKVVICEPGGPGAGLVGLDAETGKDVWKAVESDAGYAAPQLVTLCGVPQVLAFPDKGVLGLEPETGKKLWSYAFPTQQQKNIPAPVVFEDRVFVANTKLGCRGLKIAKDGEAWKAEKIWENGQERPHFGSPVLHASQGCLYVHDGKGAVKCLKLLDGTVAWSAEGQGEQQAQLLLLDDAHLLVQKDSGSIAMLEVSAQAFKEVAAFQALAKPAFAPPAVANGRLYVRDYKTLVCFDLKAK